MNNLIATSRRGQMRALAVQGIFATDCHAQLRGLILRHLSPAHAALLAEPQHDAQKQGIDWYADLPGRPVRCADLPENEAQALRARAATLARDISETARRLRETSGHEHGLSGALLALVPLHATEDDLWSVDGQPVLINWGFAPGGPGAEAQDLTRLGSAPAPAPTPAVAAAAPVVPPAGGGRGCLWWLLPLLLRLCRGFCCDLRRLQLPGDEAPLSLLADRRFCLCGASFVLNYQHVAGVKGQTALLDDGQVIPLPRTAAAEFKRAWGNYWLEEHSP